jgi:hypothetical protein
MIMTSDNLVRDLRDVSRLIAALSTPYNGDEEDFEDLRWLQARRKLLLALLEVRREQRGKKVVSLDVWRNGRGAKISADRAPPAEATEFWNII